MTDTMTDRPRRMVEDQRIAPENVNRVGRPTKLTQPTVDLLCGAIRAGCNIREAADVAGVSEQAVHNWKRKALDALAKAGVVEGMEYFADDVLAKIPEADHPYVEFWWQFRPAESFGDLELLTRIRTSPDWRASWALLKARHPDRYGDRLALTGADGGPVQITAARSSLTDKLDRLIGSNAIDAASEPVEPKRARKPTKKAAGKTTAQRKRGTA